MTHNYLIVYFAIESNILGNHYIISKKKLTINSIDRIRQIIREANKDKDLGTIIIINIIYLGKGA